MLSALLALTLTAAPGYDEGRLALETRRVELAKAWTKDKPGTRLAARQALLNYVDEVAFPSWSGTPWAFSGTTTTPREGAIACGYFVTTVLEQASFKLERVKLAQQASAYIVSTLARGTKVEWLKPKDPASALASMRRHFPTRSCSSWASICTSASCASRVNAPASVTPRTSSPA